MLQFSSGMDAQHISGAAHLVGPARSLQDPRPPAALVGQRYFGAGKGCRKLLFEEVSKPLAPPKPKQQQFPQELSG